jgi:hypothetical protein
MTVRRLLPLVTVLPVLAATACASAAERIVRFDPAATSRSGLRAQLGAPGLRSAVP